jgi:hypothetical protein
MRNNLNKSTEHAKAHQATQEVDKPSKQANMTTGAKKSKNVEEYQNFGMQKFLTEATPSRHIKKARKSKADLEVNQPTSKMQ